MSCTQQTSKVTIENTRGMRFAVVQVVNGEFVDIYNTTGLNEAPADIWGCMDPEAVAKQHGAIAVHKSGPKFWLMDSQTVTFGETACFGGLEARWAARVPVEALLAQGGVDPYHVFTPEKTETMVYNRGKAVFELIDPDGHAYVLQAYKPAFTLHSLSALGDRMRQLPDGWKFRTEVLDADLVLDLGPDTTIHAVSDEFQQYYVRIPEGSG